MHKIYPEEAGASKTLVELMNYMQTWVGSVNTTDTEAKGSRQVPRCFANGKLITTPIPE